MIVRIWTTKVKEGKLQECNDFANVYSLPMFKSQSGFAGVLFLNRLDCCKVISFWNDPQAIEKLAVSKS